MTEQIRRTMLMLAFLFSTPILSDVYADNGLSSGKNGVDDDECYFLVPGCKALVFEGNLTSLNSSFEHSFDAELGDVVKIIPRPAAVDTAYYSLAVGPEGEEQYCKVDRWKGSSGNLGNGLIFRVVDSEPMVLTVSAYSEDTIDRGYGPYKVTVIIGKSNDFSGYFCREIAQ